MGATGFDVTKFLARLCEDYGVPVSCTSDGGPNLTAKVVEDMMRDYASTTGLARWLTHMQMPGQSWG